MTEVVEPSLPALHDPSEASGSDPLPGGDLIQPTVRKPSETLDLAVVTNTTTPSSTVAARKPSDLVGLGGGGNPFANPTRKASVAVTAARKSTDLLSVAKRASQELNALAALLNPDRKSSTDGPEAGGKNAGLKARNKRMREAFNAGAQFSR